MRRSLAAGVVSVLFALVLQGARDPSFAPEIAAGDMPLNSPVELRVQLTLSDEDGSPAQGTYALLIHQPSARPPRSTRVQQDVTPSGQGTIEATFELPDWIDPLLPVEVMASEVDPPVVREFLDELWLDPLQGRRASSIRTPAQTDRVDSFELLGLELELQPAPVQWQLLCRSEVDEPLTLRYRTSRKQELRHADQLVIPTNVRVPVYGWADHPSVLVSGSTSSGLALPEVALGDSGAIDLLVVPTFDLEITAYPQLWEEGGYVILAPYDREHLPRFLGPQRLSHHSLLLLHGDYPEVRIATATLAEPQFTWKNVPSGRYLCEFWSLADREAGRASRTVAINLFGDSRVTLPTPL